MKIFKTQDGKLLRLATSEIWNYEDPYDCVEYGLLYNGYCVTSPYNLTSSDDWYLMTGTESSVLRTYVGNTLGMKEKGTTYWTTDQGQTNSFGFSARGSGFRQSTGEFLQINTTFAIWNGNVPNQTLFYANSNTYGLANGITTQGMAVRLRKDAPGIADGVHTTYTGNDGQIYDAVCINENYYTVQNLKETKFRGGYSIPFHGTDNGSNFTNAEWAALTTPGVCAYNNDLLNVGCDFAWPPEVPLPLDEGQLIMISGTLSPTQDVIYSIDGGSTWSDVPSTTNNDGSCAVAASDGGGVMIAIAKTGRWRSLDHGTTWTAITPSGSYPQYAYMSWEGKYGLACHDRVSYTEDYGETWTMIQADNARYMQGQISDDGKYMQYCSRIYTPGFWFSNNYVGGITQLSSSGAWYVAAVSSSGQYMLKGIYNTTTMLKSNDYGDSWTSVGGSALWVNAAMSYSGQHQYITIGTTSIYYSDDYGATWGTITAPVVAYKISTTKSGQYVAFSSASNGAYYSDDYGANWTQLTTGSSGAVYAILVR